MNTYDYFEMAEDTAIGVAIRESLWLFPVIEAVHLLGLALLGGSVLMMVLRLMGLGLSNQSVREVLAQTSPWFNAALVIMFSTGIPLFLSEAIKCYYNDSFWVKMTGLGIGVVYVYLVQNPLIRRGVVSGEGVIGGDGVVGVSSSVVQKFMGLVLLVIWVTVAAAGRWIGFSG